MQLTLHTASIIVSSKIKRYGTIDYSISKILLSKPRRSPWLRHAATHLFLPPPYVIGHVFVYTPWLRVHPKTLIYLLDVSPSTTAFIPPPLFLDSTSKNSQLSRSPRRSCRCPLIPRNRTRFHRKDPHREGGRERERDVDFFVISFVLSMWYDALNIQRERDVSSSSSSFLHLPGKHAQWAETHSDERWFRCTREQREETGRNGVGVRSLSPSLLPPSHSPLLRPGWCMRVAERRGCWRHHFEVRVCFRGKLDIELIFLPSIPLVVD